MKTGVIVLTGRETERKLRGILLRAGMGNIIRTGQSAPKTTKVGGSPRRPGSANKSKK